MKAVMATAAALGQQQQSCTTARPVEAMVSGAMRCIQAPLHAIHTYIT